MHLQVFLFVQPTEVNDEECPELRIKQNLKN